MLNPYLESFPYLDQFVGVWFGQGSELVSDSVEDAVTRFVEVTEPLEVWATVADIERFLTYKSDDLDTAFDALSSDAPRPQAWHMNAEEWLHWVKKLIEQQAPQLPVQSSERNPIG